MDEVIWSRDLTAVKVLAGLAVVLAAAVGGCLQKVLTELDIGCKMIPEQAFVPAEQQPPGNTRAVFILAGRHWRRGGPECLSECTAFRWRELRPCLWPWRSM